jgi:hypothetical protein
MKNASIITRIWHGRTRVEHADKYLEYLRNTGLTDYLKTPGIISAKILRRKAVEVCHFWTVTEWPDIESIKKFAGNDFEKARYYPEDEQFLLEFEETVIHCETFEEVRCD